MKKRLSVLLLLVLFALTACGETAADAQTRTVYAMDTVMNLTAYGADEETLNAAETLLHELDTAVLSRTAEGSALARLNADGAGEYDAEDALCAAVKTALSVSEATFGAFDPTLARVMDAWGFTGEAYRVPERGELAALRAQTGADKVTLHETETGCAVALADGVQLDLGGIAKGYAADLLRAQLREAGVDSAALDLGGDVCVLGTKPDGSAWRIAVKDPADGEGYLGVLTATDVCIVTSGVYERYFEENGVRYHHIIDPATFCPAESGLVSVTVVCENGAWADALSTACFVLGAEDALSLRETLAAQGTAAFELLFVTEDGVVRYTDGLADRFVPNEESGYRYEAVS